MEKPSTSIEGSQMDFYDALSFDGKNLLDGFKGGGDVTFRPFDMSNKDERALYKVYDAFVDYFSNNSVGFKASAFHFYELHGVLGAWHYCLAINYIDKFDPGRGDACDEANQNFFWQPPLIHSVKAKEYFKAPFEPGENPALWAYGTLKESMRRYGDKPSMLIGKTLDELMIVADSLTILKYNVSLGGNLTAAFAEGAGLVAMKAVQRSLGIAGVIWGVSIDIIEYVETAYKDEIKRRIDADPNDEVDEKYFRSRLRDLNLQKLTIEFGASK